MVSVIIPCYNYGHLIADTINSILRQTYTNWEIIIVDDGSTDNTAGIVEEFVKKDSRISFYQQNNAGPSTARNLALSKASGEFIQFLDADDLIEDRKFEIQLSIFKEKPFVDVVYGSVRYFSDEPFNPQKWKYTFWGSNKEWMPKISGAGKDILVPALKGSFGHISSFLFRKSIVDKAGQWNEKKRAAEDYLFVLECVLQNAFFLYHDLPGSYSLVRWHPDNTSRNVQWIHEQEREMRIEMAPRLLALGNSAAVETNNQAIKALSIMTKKTWRKKFLSGGPFDFLKKGLQLTGLERIVKKIFYK